MAAQISGKYSASFLPTSPDDVKVIVEGEKRRLIRAKRLNLALAIVVAAFSLICVALAVIYDRKSELDQLEWTAARVTGALEARFSSHVMLLRGLEGLFSASVEVAESEFQQYFKTLDAKNHLPALEGVQLISTIRGKADGFKPSYIARFTPSIKGFSQAELNDAALQAVLKDVAAKGVPRLIPARVNDSELFALILPLYKREPQIALSGFVIAKLNFSNISAFLSENTAGLAGRKDLQVSLKAGRNTWPQEENRSIIHPFKIAGQELELLVQLPEGAVTQWLGTTTLITSLCSLLLWGVIFGLTRNAHRSRSKLIQMMAQITAKLSRNTLILDAVIDNVPVMLFVKDPENGTYKVWNRAAEEITGIPRDQIIDRTGREWLDEEELKRFQETDRKVLSGDILHAYEESISTPNGQRLFYTKKVPLKCSDPDEIYLLGVSEDITAMRKLQQEKASVQRFEAVGSLAAGIAHEINTPVQYVDTNLVFLKEKLDKLFYETSEAGATRPEAALAAKEPLLQKMRQAITEAAEGVSRVSSIVCAMQTFANPGSQTMQRVSVNEVLEKVVLVSRNLWKNLATVETDLDPDIPALTGLPAELSQALLAIVMNALDALTESKNESRNLSIKTSTAGNWVQITIKDNGPGIAAEILPRLYDPFFTTKPPGKGTGQGLTIARNVIVTQHRGSIDISSELGLGTEVIVKLPLNYKEIKNEMPLR